MGVDWLRKNEKVLFEANFENLSTDDQCKSIMFVSIHAVSQGRFENACQRPEAFEPNNQMSELNLLAD